MTDIFESLKDTVVDDSNFTPIENSTDFYGNIIPASCASNKGYIWITDGKDSSMIHPSQEIPQGWKEGRTYTFTDEGRKRNLHQLKHNNPNSKTYKIVYSDGTEETVTQLSTWCRQKGLNYSSIKGIVRNKPKKRNRKYQFISDILLVTSKVS